MELEAIIEIIVRTVYRVFIWIINLEIVLLNVMVSWNLLAFGLERAVSGRLFIGAEFVEKLFQTELRQMIIR